MTKVERVNLRLKLAEILKERNVSQKELADAIGIRQGTVSDYVRGARDGYKFKIIVKMMNYFEIEELTDFIEFTDK